MCTQDDRYFYKEEEKQRMMVQAVSIEAKQGEIGLHFLSFFLFLIEDEKRRVRCERWRIEWIGEGEEGT